MADSILTITEGPMGTGKSYRRCGDFILHDFLPDGVGVHWSNFPINVEQLAKLALKHHKIPVEETRRRVRRIPEDVFKTWCDDDMVEGPWSFFGDGSDDRPPLSGVLLAIDEAHHVVPHGHKPGLPRRKKWSEFVREVRHDGATVELISQNVDAIDQNLVKIAARRLRLSSRGTDRDPFFGIPYDSWYELRSKLAGYWTGVIIEREDRRTTGGWEEVRRKQIPLSPEVFDCYDSFAARAGVDEYGNQQKVQRQFERRSFIGLYRWFALKYMPELVSRSLMVVAFCWVCFGGLGAWGIERVINMAQETMYSTTGLERPQKAADVVDSEILEGFGEEEEHNTTAVSTGDVEIIPPVAATEVPIDEVVAVFEGSVYLSVGGEVGIGDRVPFGPMEGHTVVFVDRRQRTVRFDDGRILRLRKSGQRRGVVSDGNRYQTLLSDGRQIRRPEGSETEGSAGGGVSSGLDVGSGHATLGVPPGARDEGSVVGGLDGGHRQQLGVSGGNGRAGFGGASTDGTAAQRRAQRGW